MEQKILSSNLNLIQKLFPFHFVMDRDRQLIRMGKGLAKLLRWNGRPLGFAQIFRADDGLPIDAATGAQREDQAVNLHFKNSNQQLKGQFLELEGLSGGIVFVGSLIFDPKEEIRELNLELSDFALYDISPNLMFVLEAQKISIQEVSLLANKLKEQADHLKMVNEELEEYAYVVSHDLQTPLRSIVGFAQLLERARENQLDENQQEYLKYIISSAKRMHSLTRDLLSYSNLHSGNLEMEAVDLNLIIAEILIDLNVYLNEVGARIDFPDLPVIQGDKKSLRRVFQNLLHNAFKFRSERPLEIALRFEERPDYWYFEIEDNGIGIEAKYTSKIFKVFQKLHHAHEYDGNGIGLSVCKKVIQQHQGEIGVKAGTAVGTCFYFTIAKDPV
ncbi:sensor histidine kinase [Flavilitoribacter nigricans]|nr:ATP-binding protein [Flavilitoribacter nigricans]